MFKAILFDADGVIRDSKHLTGKSCEKAFQAIGVDLHFSEDDVWRLRGFKAFNKRSDWFKALYAVSKSNSDLHFLLQGVSQPERKILALGKKFVLPEEKIPLMAGSMQDFFSERQSPTYSGVKETLEFLSKNSRLGIVTDSSGENTRKWLEYHEMNFFQTIIGNEDAAFKPDPKGILKALEVLGVKKEDTCYVGDIPNDILAAKNAGVRSVAITTGMCTREMLEKYGPDYIVDSLSELKKMA